MDMGSASASAAAAAAGAAPRVVWKVGMCQQACAYPTVHISFTCMLISPCFVIAQHVGCMYAC